MSLAPYLKSSAAELVKAFATHPGPVIITQSGETKMVVMDIVEYEKQQELCAISGKGREVNASLKQTVFG
jgi:prevent-host-death family protein